MPVGYLTGTHVSRHATSYKHESYKTPDGCVLIYNPKNNVVREYPNSYVTRWIEKADKETKKKIAEERKRGQKQRKKQKAQETKIGKKRQEMPNIYRPDLDFREG